MNIKILSFFVSVLGALVLIAGIALYSTNSPVPAMAFDPSRSEQTIFGRNDLGNYARTREANRRIAQENAIRADRRETASLVALGGGGVLLLGVGIFVASRKKPA